MVKVFPGFTEVEGEFLSGKTPQVTPRFYAYSLHFGLCCLADPVKSADGQGGEKGECLRGADNRDAVRFVQVGGDLGEEFVAGYAGGGGKPGGLENPPANPLGQAGGGCLMDQVFGEIKKGLVQRKRFHLIGVVMKNCHDLV